MRSAIVVSLGFLAACGTSVLPLGEGGSDGAGASGHGGSSSEGASSQGASAQGGAGQGASGLGGFGHEGGAFAQGGSSASSFGGFSGSGGSSSTGVETCAPLGGACSSCVSIECSASWCACTDNPECLATLVCFGQCTTDPCYSDCLSEHSAGASDALLVLGCPGCAGQCGSQPNDPCTECLYTDCEDQTNACVAEPDCLPLWQCLNDCPPGGLTCQSDCYDAYPDGIMVLESLFNCAGTTCSSTCG